MHRRRRGSALLALGLIASLLVPTAVTAPPAVAAPSGGKKVIVQLFEWNWPSVASECQSTLGPKGYGYVQVSPPQEHVRGNQWWLAYQPVSYRIESRKGTRAQFQSMVNTCHAAGVKVIVDAVINHMSGHGQGRHRLGRLVLLALRLPGHLPDPGLPPLRLPPLGRNGNDDIANYNDRYEVQNCELVNLSDLTTESDYVRTKIAAYLNDLLSLGVDGFRVDASKPHAGRRHRRHRASFPAPRTWCRRSSTAPASRSSRPSTPATATCTSSATARTWPGCSAPSGWRT